MHAFERQLILSAYLHDRSDKNLLALIDCHMPLVFYIYSSLELKFTIEKEEIESIGTLAIIQAVNSFDISSDIEFSTYVGKIVRNSFIKFITQIPQHNIQLSFFFNDPKNADSLYEDNTTESTLTKLLNQLDDREQFIIKKYHGIEGDSESFTQIASYLSINKQRVNFIYNRTMKKLKDYINNLEQ